MCQLAVENEAPVFLLKEGLDHGEEESCEEGCQEGYQEGRQEEVTKGLGEEIFVTSLATWTERSDLLVMIGLPRGDRAFSVASCVSPLAKSRSSQQI